MTFYRKKPVVIEAVQFMGQANANEVIDWIVYGGGTAGCTAEGLLVVETLEGDMKAKPGDYIIKGVHGEFYPCKPDIFAATYEELA